MSQSGRLVQVTGPTAEPLSLTEAKTHLRVSTTDEDALITSLIAAARQFAETKTQRQIMAARWKLFLDSFPAPTITQIPYARTYGLPRNAILIPRAAVLDVVSVKYLDLAGVQQTLVAGQTNDYVVDASDEPCRITPPFGKIWPASVMPQKEAVEVVFDAGMLAPMTFDANADTGTVNGIWKTLAVDDTVRFTNRDGALPAPLAANTDYYVQSAPSAGVYKFAASAGGAAIDLTSAGTGESFITQSRPNELGGLKAWMLLSIGTLYENREAVTIDTRINAAELPLEFIDGLLDPYRMVLY